MINRALSVLFGCDDKGGKFYFSLGMKSQEKESSGEIVRRRKPLGTIVEVTALIFHSWVLTQIYLREIGYTILSDKSVAINFIIMKNILTSIDYFITLQSQTISQKPRSGVLRRGM